MVRKAPIYCPIPIPQSGVDFGRGQAEKREKRHRLGRNFSSHFPLLPDFDRRPANFPTVHRALKRKIPYGDRPSPPPHCSTYYAQSKSHSSRTADTGHFVQVGNGSFAGCVLVSRFDSPRGTIKTEIWKRRGKKNGSSLSLCVIAPPSKRATQYSTVHTTYA